MIRLRSNSNTQPSYKAQRAQPVINPIALQPEPDGLQRRALEVSHNRLMLGLGLFAVAFVVIAVRLAAVTLIPGDHETMRVAVAPSADRADILDRNGVVLATSLTTASLYANPHQIREPDAVAAQLAEILPDMPASPTAAKLSADKSFIWLKRNLTPKQQQAVNRLGVPGLYFQYETKRVYPQGNLTAHVVGFADVDSRGLAGVERSFDDVLAGGQRPLQLSIDVRIQHILHEEISRAMTDFTAIGGAGMVMDIQTGELLALVSLPDFDPARPGEATDDARFNRATLGTYEMGSTFKLFNTAIGLDSGTTTLAGGFDATHSIKIGRFSIDDYHGKHRWLSIPEIFTYSSNIGSAKLADAFGAEVQKTYLQRFGLLTKSPVELAEIGEPQYPKNWRRVNTMTISYGHGLSVAPIQVVSAVGAIANGGTLRQPTLLKRAAHEVETGTRVISEQTSAQMRQLMRLVVQVGTGKKANAPGYLVGGKTGTADKQEGRGYSENARMAAFVAAFPMSAPRYAVVVLIDEPKPNAHSYGYATAGWVAAPVVGALVQRMAPLMGISPIPDDSPLAQNPLVAMVADYDSAASKKAKSNVIQAAAPAPDSSTTESPATETNDGNAPLVFKAKPFGATPVSATNNDVTTPPAPEAPLETEGMPLAVE
ncbi:penicillin-binding transpeptidase domain-containing protein [Dongia sp.]|uniref:penicillin-binding transpeptidase domain-containing protein n=1 Tax=Dongia sp. TaxID=1977262 RepID=UPI0035AD9FF1